MLYDLRHTTRYRYTTPVTLCHNEARMLPRDFPQQRCATSHVHVAPLPQRQHERLDYFGNRVLYLTLQELHRELEVTVRTRLETLPQPALPETSPPWETVRERLDAHGSTLAREAYLYRQDSPFIKRHTALAELAQRCFTPGRPLLEAALELNRYVHEHFTYDPEVTTLATPLADVLAQRRGVCQDFAHLMIGALRSVGLAARYVSGYLETRPPPGQPRLIGADASHAWLAVLIPEWGWLALDPTNGTLAAEQHPVLAWGRDYTDVTPLKGVVNGGGQHALEVEVDVIPAAEAEAASRDPGTTA